MEATIDAVSGKSKLRYPLRSATKSKESKQPPIKSDPSPSSATSNRGARIVSSVAKSVIILDLSGKEKSANKPPRRLSIPPAKSSAAIAIKPATISKTPISEIRTRSSSNFRGGNTETPISEVSRSLSRKKFSVLSSTSYWLSQIKLSESAANHSISLGFFRLAFEAKCEPIQRLHEELKSYARRYGLDESLKELVEIYNIPDTPKQVQESQTFSQVSEEEGTRLSDDEVRSSSSTAATKPRSTKTGAARVSSVRTSANKHPSGRTRASLSRISANSDSISEGLLKKPQKPNKQELNDGKEKWKKHGKKPSIEEGQANQPNGTVVVEENKENMDGLATIELIQTQVE